MLPRKEISDWHALWIAVAIAMSATLLYALPFLIEEWYGYGH